jgi:hypothetical protein
MLDVGDEIDSGVLGGVGTDLAVRGVLRVATVAGQ